MRLTLISCGRGIPHANRVLENDNAVARSVGVVAEVAQAGSRGGEDSRTFFFGTGRNSLSSVRYPLTCC